jgi:Protein of unknown function (DUF3619)
MTNSTLHTTPSALAPTTNALTHEQFAHRLVGHLDMATMSIAPDVLERMRFSRQRALAAQKIVGLQTSTASSWYVQAQANQSLAGAAQGFGQRSFFSFDSFGKWGSFIPLAALIVGLLVIQHFQGDLRAKELAEIDAALLIDDLPPAAYTDQGFSQFLKLQLEE